MQYPGNSNLTAWRYYFRWQGSVNTANPASWAVNYGAQTGPAPDGEEYFAIALYLADRRWGSDGAVNYRADADNLARAMINNPAAGGRTAVINANSNMVVFYPQGNTANYSDPSYHLPAFYEIFAESSAGADAARWQQIAETSRQFLVTSAHPTTGLHPDFAWGSADARMQTQVEKYHAFFSNYLRQGNVTSALFNLDGSGAAGGGSTALTATLAAGALASDAPDRDRYVQNLWEVAQQSGEFRYYQETVYLLGLLATAGQFGYEWADAGAP
jgi:oligosaccharide reducing-end xylanase